MAITEDILFQPETEIVPVLDKMMAPLLEGRDEKPNQYMFLFHPFLRDGCPLPGGQWTEHNWVGKILQLLEVVEGGIPEGHKILEVAWAATQKWIDLDMAADHDAVPATVRSRLNTVGRHGGDAEEGPENSGTHTLRRNWEGYKIAAKRYIPYLFLCQFICTKWEEERIQHLIDISGDIFDTAVARVRYEGIIPRLIVKSLVYIQQRYYHGTPVHAFLLSHLFCKQRGAEENGIHVNRPNTVGKPLSSFLALIKVAMQTSWCKYDNVEGAQKVEVEKICEGPVYSIICTAISRFRMMQKKEPHDAPSEVDDDGTVWVGSIRYRPEVTFRIIPVISTMCRNILEKILIGSAWSLLFCADRDNVTIAQKCSRFDIHHFGATHTSTRSESIRVNGNQPGINGLLKRLMGLVLLSLTILGGGAVRWEETMELVDLAHVSYSGGLFTYYAQVWKQPKYNHTAIGNLIQHKLPWSLSPVAILLFAVILPWMKEEGITFTPNQLRDEMLLIFKELYELHDNQTVTLEDLRQFCAGFINWAMPDNTGAVSRSRHSFIPTNYHF